MGSLSGNSAHNGRAQRGHRGRVSFALRPRSAACALSGAYGQIAAPGERVATAGECRAANWGDWTISAVAAYN
jgi:hypothetical protein